MILILILALKNCVRSISPILFEVENPKFDMWIHLRVIFCLSGHCGFSSRNNLKNGLPSIAVFFKSILATNIESCSKWQKVCFFPISRRIFPIQGTKKLSPFCDILTALYHSKLYFCISKFEMCLLVNQIFDFFGYLIILYSVSFSQFGIKRREKFPILEVGSCFKIGRKSRSLLHTGSNCFSREVRAALCEIY